MALPRAQSIGWALAHRFWTAKRHRRWAEAHPMSHSSRRAAQMQRNLKTDDRPRRESYLKDGGGSLLHAVRRGLPSLSPQEGPRFPGPPFPRRAVYFWWVLAIAHDRHDLPACASASRLVAAWSYERPSMPALFMKSEHSARIFSILLNGGVRVTWADASAPALRVCAGGRSRSTRRHDGIRRTRRRCAGS